MQGTQQVHPTDWTCPGCGKVHSRPHWKDYHQKEPGWKDKLDKHFGDKSSDVDYRIVCEICGDKLVLRVEDTGDLVITKECPVCHALYTGKNDKYCSIDGCELDIPEAPSHLFCETCQEKREGVEAPLFCPHCGWGEERLVLVIK